MRKAPRFALLLVICGAALAWAGSAFAAFTPKLIVSGIPAPGAGPATGITVSVGPTEDPTARVTIYIPNGFQVNTTTAPATKLGAVEAKAVAADLGGIELPLTGDVLAAAPSTFATQAAQCGVTPAVVWDLHLTAAGQTLDVPMFVVPNAGAEAAISQYKLVICLPPPDVPQGTPGRATFGAKLTSAALTVSALTSPTASGEYRWRSLWTPYTPNTGQPNAAGTVETQSLVRLPTQLSLQAKKSRVVKGTGKAKRTWTRITIAGQVLEATQGVASVKVAVQTGASSTALKTVKTVATNSSGIFTTTLLVKAPTWIRASAKLALRELGTAGCVQNPPLAAGLPCNNATIAGAQVVSPKVKVTPYRFK